MSLNKENFHKIIKIEFSTEHELSLIGCFFSFLAIIQEILVFGCLPEPNQRRGKNIQLENKSIDVFRNVFSFDLVKKDASLKPNFRIQKGKEIFGR